MDDAAAEAALMAALLQGAAADGEGSGAYGSPGVGTGADVLMELERIRANLLALAEVVEGLRAKYNGHTHVENVAAAYAQNAVTNAPVVGQQEGTGYVPH